MQTVATLLNLACGKDELKEDDSHAQRLRVVIGGLLASLVLSSLWGLAAGSKVLPLALQNVYKLPMLVLFSTLAAVPAGLLAWKLTGAKYRASDLLASHSSGVLSGTMVLAVLAPLVALFYHSSTWAGPVVAMGSVFTALLVAIVIFTRGVWRRAVEGQEVHGQVAVTSPNGVPVVPPRRQLSRLSLWLPVVVVLGIKVAALVQLIAVLSPILPELTAFDGGVDTLINNGADRLLSQ